MTTVELAAAGVALLGMFLIVAVASFLLFPELRARVFRNADPMSERERLRSRWEQRSAGANSAILGSSTLLIGGLLTALRAHLTAGKVTAAHFVPVFVLAVFAALLPIGQRRR